MGKLLFHRPLSAAAAREALAWSTEHGLAAHVNHLERFVLPASDPRADDYSAFLGARAEIVPDLMAWIQKPVTKILAVADAPLPTLLLPEARAHFAGRAEVTVSHPEFLEFLAPGVSKGAAVRWLARRLGIPLEQTMAIGDQFNDLEMIEDVGHGVAMPSAPPEVQARARYVAPPVSEEGAAQVVEALVLPGRDGAAERRPISGSTVTARVLRDDSTGRAEAIHALRSGGLVGLPTDTVYGLAVALDAPDGIERLFAAKGRPPDKAIVLLVADIGQAERTGVFGHAARALAAALWPGALTLVVPAATRGPPARDPDRRRLDDRAAAAGPRDPASTGPGPRTTARDLGQPIRRARPDERAGPRDRVQRRARGHPRRRPGTRWHLVDGRPLRRLGHRGPAGGGDPAGSDRGGRQGRPQGPPGGAPAAARHSTSGTAARGLPRDEWPSPGRVAAPAERPSPGRVAAPVRRCGYSIPQNGDFGPVVSHRGVLTSGSCPASSVARDEAARFGPRASLIAPGTALNQAV